MDRYLKGADPPAASPSALEVLVPRRSGCSARPDAGGTGSGLQPIAVRTSRVSAGIARRPAWSGRGPLPKFLCQVMQAMPRRARRLNRSGLQPSRSNTRVSAGTPASGLVRSGAASGTTPRCCRCGTTSCCDGLDQFRPSTASVAQSSSCSVAQVRASADCQSRTVSAGAKLSC